MATVGWFPARFTSITSVAASPGAIGDNAGMVDKRAAETVCIMAITAIGTGYRVAGYRGRLGGRVNAIGFIVA